jgi:hypothetical protein
VVPLGSNPERVRRYPINASLPKPEHIGFSEKILICFAYPHQHDAIKNWRWSMKVSRAVNLFMDYHKMNSQKKYD